MISDLFEWEPKLPVSNSMGVLVISMLIYHLIIEREYPMNFTNSQNAPSSYKKCAVQYNKIQFDSALATSNHYVAETGW